MVEDARIAAYADPGTAGLAAFMVKGFISYSHDDIEQCRSLRAYLDVLHRVHDITFWADDDIRAGDHWDRRIRAAIDEADIFLLLCSLNWLRTGYIQTDEIPAIHARAEKANGLVIPVILRNCPWTDEYGDLQAVPTHDGRLIPIAAWGDSADGYVRAGEQIAAQIRHVFKLPTIKRTWRSVVAVQDQDPSGITWIKIAARFVAETGGDISDDQATQDPTVRQLHDHLRDRTARLAGLLASAPSDPDTDDQRRIAAERTRALAEALAGPTDTVPIRIGDLYDSIQRLAISRDAVRHARTQRANRPGGLDTGEYAELDGLATQAALWIRQFPRARALDHASVSPRDLPRLAPLAGTIISAALAARLIDDEDASRILSLLADPDQTDDAATAARSRAVLGTRNLLYRLGIFVLGFVPDPILPGSWDDRHLANAVAGLLVDQAEGLTSFMVGLPGEVREAFGHLIAATQEHGLRPSVPAPNPVPPPPIDPPGDFSLEEVRRRVLAGEAVPAAWVPFVTALDLSFANLRDVTPLATMTALRSLDLTATQVSDVRPLGALTALQSLDLMNTLVRDVRPLRTLTALQSLGLRNTRVSDVTPLSVLTALRSLNLRYTPVRDMTSLGALTALQFLDLMNTRVSDVTPLRALTALHGLNLEGLSVRDLTPLDALTALQSLNLRDTQVSDLTPLRVVTALQSLNLRATQVRDLTPLAALTALQSLDLMNTQVSDLTPLRALTALQSLDLMNTRVSNVRPLAALTNLQSLDLGHTQVWDVTPLGRLTTLQSLNLMNTALTDVSPLRALTALQSLDLMNTRVSDVTPLSGLITLQVLDLEDTPVSDVSPLRALTALQSLDLRGTPVSDVTPLTAMTALRSLDLRGTQVGDVTPLASLKELNTLDLTGTRPAGVEALRRLGLEIRGG